MRSQITPTGIRLRHGRGCRSLDGGRCDCRTSYEAHVYDTTSRRKIRRSFPTLAAAKTWKSDAEHGVRRGTLRASGPTTVAEAADALFTVMGSGAVRTRSGDQFKPSTVRGYQEAFNLHVRQDLGAVKLGDVTRRHVQGLADSLSADGRSPSTVRNALMPIRVIFRRALRDGLVSVNPTGGVELPANRSRRVEIVSPEAAANLIDALPAERDRALWATAFYAGLRRGELMALRWRDLDLAGGTLSVEKSYDPKARQYVEPKSRAGRRRVPIADVLRGHLRALAIASKRSDPGALVFSEDGRPFAYDALLARSRSAWKTAELRRRRPSRRETYRRVADDRRRSQRQSALGVYGSRVDHDYVGPVRPSAAGLSGGGGRALGRVPRSDAGRRSKRNANANALDVHVGLVVPDHRQPRAFARGDAHRFASGGLRRRPRRDLLLRRRSRPGVRRPDGDVDPQDEAGRSTDVRLGQDGECAAVSVVP